MAGQSKRHPSDQPLAMRHGLWNRPSGPPVHPEGDPERCLRRAESVGAPQDHHPTLLQQGSLACHVICTWRFRSRVAGQSKRHPSDQPLAMRHWLWNRPSGPPVHPEGDPERCLRRAESVGAPQDHHPTLLQQGSIAFHVICRWKFRSRVAGQSKRHPSDQPLAMRHWLWNRPSGPPVHPEGDPERCLRRAESVGAPQDHHPTLLQQGSLTCHVICIWDSGHEWRVKASAIRVISSWPLRHWLWNRPSGPPVHPEGDPERCLRRAESVGAPQDHHPTLLQQGSLACKAICTWKFRSRVAGQSKRHPSDQPLAMRHGLWNRPSGPPVHPEGDPERCLRRAESVGAPQDHHPTLLQQGSIAFHVICRWKFRSRVAGQSKRHPSDQPLAVRHWLWNRPSGPPVHPEDDPERCLRRAESVGAPQDHHPTLLQQGSLACHVICTWRFRSQVASQSKRHPSDQPLAMRHGLWNRPSGPPVHPEDDPERCLRRAESVGAPQDHHPTLLQQGSLTCHVICTWRFRSRVAGQSKRHPSDQPLAVRHWLWNRPSGPPVHPEGDPERCLRGAESVGAPQDPSSHSLTTRISRMPCHMHMEIQVTSGKPKPASSRVISPW